MKRPLILHPFLFVLFVVFSVYATNLTEVHFEQLLRPVGTAFTAAVLLMCLFRLVSRGWRRAGLAASLVLVLFFTYGHVFSILRQLLPPGSLLAQADVLMAVWASVMIVGVWVVIRKLGSPRKATVVVNVIAGAALAASLLGLAATLLLIRQGGEITFKQPADLAAQPGPGWTGEKPDVYYIILDGYGREDVLRDIYDVDNTTFLDSLRQRGFRVTEKSHTNYWKTALSLSSSLNYHYLEDLIELRPESTDPRALEKMISDSAARRFFEALGYRTVAFSTGYNFSEVRDADVYYPSLRPLEPFEMNLLEGSMGIIYVDWALPAYHRRDVLQNFHQLRDTYKIDGPKFVFAHLVIPHPPFVFDEHGEAAAPMGMADGIEYSGGLDHYKKGYAAQVQYANQLVEETIDSILANSKTPPVIIIQGDHGPGAYLDWSSYERSCLSERFPILNAYYFPGKEQESQAIPEDVSPVNSFRILLNTYFDTGLVLETNRHYAAHPRETYRLYDVTNRLDWCPYDTGLPAN